MNTDTLSQKIWEAFIGRIRAMRNETPKKTLQQIGDLCGVSKPTVLRWLEGDNGNKITFSDMLRYMDAVGLDVEQLTPRLLDERTIVLQNQLREKEQLFEITKEKLNECERQLATYKAKWEGHLETVRAQNQNTEPSLENILSRAG